MHEQPLSERKTQNRVIALFGEWNKSGTSRALKQTMLQQLPPGKIRLK